MKRVIYAIVLMITGCLLYGCLLSGIGYALRQPTKDTVVQVTEPEPAEQQQFPCPVPGTGLIVEHMVAYDGPFLEDGTDVPACDIVAMMLCNAGSRFIKQAEITLETEEGTLCFTGTCIPGFSRVILLEKTAMPWREIQVLACSGRIVTETGGLGSEQIRVCDDTLGSLQVTNQTDRTLQRLRIYYKNVVPQTDILLGGVTYCAVVAVLEPGQTVLRPVTRYLPGNSRIVWMETA